MKCVFVTGGSGFLGRNIIAVLREHGYEVRALARSEHAMKNAQSAGAEPVLGDLDDREALRVGMSGCTTVFHAAAMVDDWGRYDEFYNVNVVGTERVLAVAKEAGVRRFVHVSTEAVLIGGTPIINADETWPLPKRPLGLYPLTKGMAEERVIAANSSDMTTIVLRPRFIWGNGDTSVLAKMLKSVKDGSWMWISGGHYLTSTCHVANVCEAMMLAASRGRGGDIYFITDGKPVEFREFVTRLLLSQGVDPGTRSIPRWLVRLVASCSELAWSLLRLRGKPPITRCGLCLIGEEVTINDAKARQELGYAPVISIEEGLAEMMHD
jgi:nucleoside-diphosphate-sugar epimerase